MGKQNVLIFCSSDDPHANILRTKLSSLDTSCFVIDINTLVKNGVSAHIESGKIFTHKLGKRVDLQDFSSIWIRKLKPLSFISSGLTTSQIDLVDYQWREMFYGLYLRLESKFWVSNPDNMRVAGNKIYQLDIASRYFDIPDTVVTNEPLEAMRFCSHNKNKIVIKPIGTKEFDKTDGHTYSIPTSRVKDKTIEKAFSGLEQTPVILQKEVTRERDLRVYVIGAKVFCVSIKPKVKIDFVDVRSFKPEELLFEQVYLTETLTKSCLELVKRFKLQYAAVDLIQDVNSRIWFLEINPLGQFLWIEESANVDISGSLALLLSGEAEPLNI